MLTFTAKSHRGDLVVSGPPGGTCVLNQTTKHQSGIDLFFFYDFKYSVPAAKLVRLTLFVCVRSVHTREGGPFLSDLFRFKKKKSNFF